MKRKNVIIIEDDFNAFKDIRTFLDTSFDCYPDISSNSPDDFKSFISLFQRCLNSGERRDIRKQMKNKLITELKKVGGDVFYIIDYALKENDTENITGKKFYDTIINEIYPEFYVPTLMLTGIDFNYKVANQIDTELAIYMEKLNKKAGKEVFKYRRKNFDDPTFREHVIDFINSSKLIPRIKGQELHPILIKINDILGIKSFIRPVTDDMIDNLFNRIEALKNKVIDEPELLNNNQLENILNVFVPPHDKNKINDLILNINQFLHDNE